MSNPGDENSSLDVRQKFQRFGYKQELKRGLSTTDLLIYGLIFMVPIAPWQIFGEIYNSSHGMVPLTYLVGVIGMIFTGLAYSEMAKSVPLSGSVFSYVGRGIHPSVGFFAGWAMLLDYLLVPTLLYVFAAEAMTGIFPGSYRWLWAVLFVAINLAINLAGINSMKLINRVFLAAECAFIVILVVIAVRALNGGTIPGASWNFDPIWTSGEVSAPLIASALSVAVLNFLGFDGISTMAEEASGGKNPAGKAMILGLVVVAVLFIGQTWLASLGAGDRESFSDSEVGNAFFVVVRAMSSSGMAKAFLVMNVLAVGIANAMAAQTATSRLLYSMSRDGQLPAFLKKINRRQVPYNGAILVAVLSAGLVIFFVGQLSLISSLVNFGALFGFMLLHVAVVVFHIVKYKSKNYTVHIVVPVIGFIVIGYVLLNASHYAQLVGVAWLIVGLGVFIFYKVTGRTVEISSD